MKLLEKNEEEFCMKGKSFIQDGVLKLPRGTWLPIRLAASLVGYSHQMLRNLIMRKNIRAIKFKNAPILVSIEEIERYKDNNGYKKRNKFTRQPLLKGE